MKRLLLLSAIPTIILSMELESLERIKKTTLPIHIAEGQTWNSYYLPIAKIAIAKEIPILNKSENTVSTFDVFNINTKKPIYSNLFNGKVKAGRNTFLLNTSLYRTKTNKTFSVAENEYLIATDSKGDIIASLQFENGKQTILFYEKTKNGTYKHTKKRIPHISNVLPPINTNYPAKQELIRIQDPDGNQVIVLDSLHTHTLAPQFSFDAQSLQYNPLSTVLATFITSNSNPYNGWAVSPETDQWFTFLGASNFGTWCIFDDNEHVLTSFYPNLQKSDKQTAFGIKTAATNGLIEVEGLTEINDFFQGAYPNKDWEFFERKKEHVCVLHGPNRAVIRICYPFLFNGEELSNVIAYFVIDISDIHNPAVEILQLQKNYIPENQDKVIVESLQKHSLLGDEKKEVIFCAYLNDDKTLMYYGEIDLTNNTPTEWHEAWNIGIAHPEAYLRNNREQYFVENKDGNLSILQPCTGINTEIAPGYLHFISNSFEFAYFLLTNTAVVVNENENGTYTISLYNNPMNDPLKEITCHDYNFTTDPDLGYFIHLLTSNPGQDLQVYHLAENNSFETTIQEQTENQTTSHYNWCSIQ